MTVIKKMNKIKIIWINLVVLVGLDQIFKYLAIQYLKGQESVSWLGGFLTLVYAENTGAFLGFGGNWGREIRIFFFVMIVILGLGSLIWYLLKNEVSKLNLYAYSFILAGGAGNLIDRIFRKNGAVVDFLLFDTGKTLDLSIIQIPLRTGVVNSADVVIVAGVVLAFANEYYSRKIILSR
ncbi:signal peptidase II [Bdellovibrio sp. qaytius]|nr:signal peptidase II [Bdellovibrio sp. qaytius]